MREILIALAIILTFGSVRAEISIHRLYSGLNHEIKFCQTQLIPDNLLYTGVNIKPNNIPDKTLNTWLNWPTDNPAVQFAIVVVYPEPNSNDSNSLKIAEERGAWLLKHFIEKGAEEGAYEIKYKVGEIAQAYVEGVGIKENK
ncbi:MAG TPA: hypothetical protein VKZ45_07795 [Vicingaceae bacterium]|nr:hypothetical protein [Vicingaceae bacterium]